MTQLQEQQTQQGRDGGSNKIKTRRRANSVAFACRTDYGLPDDSDDESPPKNPLFLVAPEAERRRSATDGAESAKERAKIFTLS